MLPNQPAHVGAVRSGFAAEARRVGGVLQRQQSPVENLAAIQIRHRHFRGRNQVQIPLAGDLEQILLELRQLPGAVQRRRRHQERRLHFGVAMLVAVQRQHEIDQRALELRAGAHQHREARAGNLRGALEIDHAQLRTEIPVRLGLEVEPARLAPRAHDDVVGGALPHRHAGVRQVRQRLEQDRALPLGAVELDFELLDLLRRASCSLRRGGSRPCPASWRAPLRRRRRSARASILRSAESGGAGASPRSRAAATRPSHRGRGSARPLCTASRLSRT